MNILEELNDLFEQLNIPIEIGIFSNVAPNTYVVLVPLGDSFEIFVNNYPSIDIQEVRISLFSKGNYLKIKNQIMKELLKSDFTITSRIFLGFDNETNYYHVAIDVAKHYEMEEF